MKAEAVQVHWHDKQPVYSACFHPRDPHLFATAGGDHNIRLWRVCPENTDEKQPVQFITTLSRHLKSVNCVRFSPSGDVLASAGDGGAILLWHKTFGLHPSRLEDGESDDDGAQDECRERWTVRAMLRAADTEDIYDLDFSPDGGHLIVGLTDNSAQVWDVSGTAGRLVKVLKDHKHFVQGVCWDPLDQFVATQSCDRYFVCLSVV